MKISACQLVMFLAVSCTRAQTPAPIEHEWRATVTVLDEASQPVGGANVEIGYYVKPAAGQTEAAEKIYGVTDTNGVFRASHPDTRSISLGFAITKPGYYPTTGGYQLGFEYDPAIWNRSSTFLLKRVAKPTPMVAKWVNLGMPVLGKPVGFDLMVGDWVPPYGNGIKTDMIFMANLEKRSEDDWDSRLIVSFPNPGDGIQPFRISALEKDSALRSPHEAFENGYQPQWIKTHSQRPGEPRKYGIDENLNFFFRVRTVLDEKGNVKSANYGKIYGDFMNFRYYFNPEVNSRNVEFDPKQNLLRGLKSTEQVSAP